MEKCMKKMFFFIEISLLFPNVHHDLVLLRLQKWVGKRVIFLLAPPPCQKCLSEIFILL